MSGHNYNPYPNGAAHYLAQSIARATGSNARNEYTAPENIGTEITESSEFLASKQINSIEADSSYLQKAKNEQFRLGFGTTPSEHELIIDVDKTTVNHLPVPRELEEQLQKIRKVKVSNYKVSNHSGKIISNTQPKIKNLNALFPNLKTQPKEIEHNAAIESEIASLEWEETRKKDSNNEWKQAIEKDSFRQLIDSMDQLFAFFMHPEVV